MSTAATKSEADILSRVIAPTKADLPPSMAEMILAFAFPNEDRDRMHYLSQKAREGTLTGEEQNEIDAYERVGHFLSLLQSKARLSLRHSKSE